MYTYTARTYVPLHHSKACLPYLCVIAHVLCTLNTHFATHQNDTSRTSLHNTNLHVLTKHAHRLVLLQPFSRLRTHYLRRSTLSSSSNTIHFTIYHPIKNTISTCCTSHSPFSLFCWAASVPPFASHPPSSLPLRICLPTKFADFNLQIELQKLDGSVDTSLPWLIRRSTSPATRILNGVKPRFSRIFTKSSPNYVDIIAQRDREIAQLRRITANQVARIELLETRKCGA